MKYQNKKEISNYIYILILICGLMFGHLNAQSFIKNELSIVEFNSSWNEKNHIKGLSKLKNCNTYRVSLCDNPNYMDKFKIKLPTIVIYNNGIEIKRYKANILFTFDVTYKDLQLDVDSMLLTKFN